MKRIELTKVQELPFQMAEAINQLRINLGFCGNNTKTVMFTSSVPNEGKSLLSLHLWKMMAEVGTKVVLVDCDFRKSELKYTAGYRSNDKIIGGAYFLNGKAQMDEVVYETNIENGYIIPVTSTVANPTIMLESERFHEMIAYCRENFDYVIIDTPPLGSVADALNIATQTDGTVLVVRGGETPRKLVEDSVSLLKRTNVPLLGVVLNRVEMTRSGAGYYKRYYRGKYYYNSGYYGSDNNKKIRKGEKTK